MKKICLVSYDMTNMGGAEQVGVSLANEFCKYYDVTILSIQFSGDKIPYQLDERVKFVTLNNRTTRLRSLPFAIRQQATNFLKENKIDVALLLGAYVACGFFFVKPAKTKMVFCDHGALMNQWDDKTITAIRWIASKRTDKIITLTEQTKNDYIEKFKVNPRKIDYIYNWIEDGYHNKYGYNEESRSIISVGRIASEKGFDMLVDIAEKALPNHPDWTWDIYGDGPDKQQIESALKEKGLEDQLILKGSVNNLKELYQEYAFLVLPSYREGLPLVLLEAKASKLPLVSFDVMTGPSEIIRDGIDGLLIQPRNIDAMAEAINTLIDNAEMRKSFSKATYQNIDKFSKNKILSQWRKLIDGK